MDKFDFHTARDLLAAHDGHYKHPCTRLQPEIPDMDFAGIETGQLKLL
jgi:hypothetical protein